jgi:membrane-associated phospholipid phosphatase
MTRHASVLVVTLSLAIGSATLPAPALAQTVTAADATPQWTVPDEDGLSLRNVVAEAFSDLTRLPSWETATILSIGGVGAAAGHRWDRDTSASMATSRDLGRALNAGGTLGSMQMQAAAAFATYAIGRATNHPKAAAIGADLIQAQIVAQVTTQGVKFAAGRTRPDGTSLSFPSGHTASAFATATVLQRNLGWKVGVPAYAVAAYVGASRIQDKRHYLSDVAFGAALGIVAGRSVTVGSGSGRFAIAPAPAPGGGGVSVTWLGAR